MDIDNILQQLKEERARIDDAISALQRAGGRRSKRVATAQNAAPRRRKRRLTPEGRKRLSEMMKKRWAERKRKAKVA